MSVPEGKRSKGRLAIETEAEDLLSFIIDITTRYYYPPNVVQRSDEDDDVYKDIASLVNAKWFAEQMRSEALACLSQVQEANKIEIRDEESFYARKAYQDRAERCIERVHTAANLMFRRKLMKRKRAKHIGGKVGHLKLMIQNWRKSDRAKYMSLQKERQSADGS